MGKIWTFAISLTIFFILLEPISISASVHRNVEQETVLISRNSTILSGNRIFALGFFSSRYLGIRYASIQIPTYVWVGNREHPVKNINATKLILNRDGCLEIRDFSNGVTVWKTRNREKAVSVSLLDSGNLVLVSDNGNVLWESFSFPTDTWLPGMKMDRNTLLTCWKRWNWDPSPGNYSLRLKQSTFGEFELVYNGNVQYWSTGNWSGSIFSNVPEMAIPYSRSFTFDNPFTMYASFRYTVLPNEYGMKPLTRFVVDSNGQIRLYIWSIRNVVWNTVWIQPIRMCAVYGLCGNLGLCTGYYSKPCECLAGFHPVDELEWLSGYFMRGCRRNSGILCGKNDMFEEFGAVNYDAASSVTFPASRSLCEKACLGNCSCIGLKHDERSVNCTNVYGSILNVRNPISDSKHETSLHVRVRRRKKKNGRTGLLLIVGVCAGVGMLILGLVLGLLWILCKR